MSNIENNNINNLRSDDPEWISEKMFGEIPDIEDNNTQPTKQDSPF